MNSKQLHNIIQIGESEKTEFKRIWKDEHLKTLCAFSNTSGGILLIGIDDNKEIVGLSNAKALLEVFHTIAF